MSDNPSAIVNGEVVSLAAEARTSLADFLRDNCDLTGLHLACEHGVCGACTVLVDQKPVRSCLVLAAQVDGSEVSTIEGLEEDELTRRLREAFTSHHALQCGFCTPGMLITARDIVTRLGAASERRIREELAGNLCRCTGYVGIVAAIAEVSALHPTPVTPTRRPERRSGPMSLAGPAANPGASQRAGADSLADIRPDWTPKKGDFSIRREFILNHPIEKVWDAFARPELIAANLPGADILESDGDRIRGKVGVRMGPIHAHFVGEALYTRDHSGKRGMLVGSGRDRLSNSRVQGRLSFALVEVDPVSTRVEVRLEFALAGPLAQFSRPALVEDFTSFVLEQFADNLSQTLAGRSVPARRRLKLGSVLLWGLRRLLRGPR